MSVTHGGTLEGTSRGDCVVIDGYAPRFISDYQDRWVTADPLRGMLAQRMLVERGVISVIDDLLPTATAAQGAFVDEFLRPIGITSKFGVRLECEPHGSVYLVVVPDAGRMPTRTNALLQALGRHLTPIAGRLLTNELTSVGPQPWRLTPRERQVAALVADGLTNQQIARRLAIGVDTVKKHLTRALAETGSNSRTQLAVRWLRIGATTPG